MNRFRLFAILLLLSLLAGFGVEPVGAAVVAAPTGPRTAGQPAAAYQAVLQTVPPFEGIRVLVNDTEYRTGADGTVILSVGAPGEYTIEIDVSTYNEPYTRLEFARWLEGDYNPVRQVKIPTKDNEPIQAGLQVEMLVGQTFVDLSGQPVDPARITSFKMRSIHGDTFTFPDGQPRWIPASRVTRRRFGGLDVVPLLYSLHEVVVDGSNVVHKSAQRFYAEPNATWTISLLLYSLRVESRDALFGFPLGDSLQLILPDGTVTYHELDRSGAVQLHSLARGNYLYKIEGGGLSTLVPVSISKDQDIQTKVISLLDIFVVVGGGLMVALGLLVVGRGRQIRESYTARRRAPVHRGVRST